METYRGKIFNEQVFEMYRNTLPSSKKNALIKSGLFTVVNKYRAKMSEQSGGYAIVEPIKGKLGGTPVNYDGNTNIPKGSERPTFYQRKVCYGRAQSWGEYDFASDITGANFKAEAGEVNEYWDEQRQITTLSILKGIFSMTGGVNGAFVSKHTYDITGAATTTLGADSINRAAQKGLGDSKAELNTMITHSMVSTNLEGLNLIDFLKYTDDNGIERDLTIGTYNGRLVIVDDDMPTSDTVTTAPVYSTTISTAATAGDKISIAGTEYTFVANDATPEDDEIKVGANGTAAQQAANIVAKVTLTGFTVTQGTSSNNNKVIFTASSGTNPTAPEVKATKAATTGTLVVTNATDTPAVVVTDYTTYLFKTGFFEYENIGLVENKPSEIARDPYDKGGKTDLITRVREAIIPMYISYTGTDEVSPENSDFETGSNWELANNNKTGEYKLYVDDKLIPLVRIISRG